MAEEQDIKQETVEETENTTNVEEPTVEKTEEAVADAAQVLEELKADFDNRYKRLQADFENFKRRTNQEKEQLAGYVKGDVLTDLLPVLDNFERAVQSPAEGEAKVFLDGFIMIHQNLMAMLSKHGLAIIEAVGQPFDPNFHQAIMRVPSDEYESDTVCEVLQTGYTVDGRCIRPAMVKVVEQIIKFQEVYIMAKVIGIDLGTTNSCVAVMEGGEPTVITNQEGARTTPSVVGFAKNGERLVGQLAKRQAVSNPENTIISIKRHMGTDYKVTVEGKSYTPQEISAMILQKIKADAEAYLGEPVKQAVITVPAYFTDAQRQATKDAGAIAGLEVLRIINEPTAAALAYGVDKDEDGKVLVFDLGGGTFDVSILELGDGVFEVLATSGNNHLGGDDFDQRIMNYLIEEFKKETGIDLSNDKLADQRLKEAAEKAKIELSGVASTNINLPFITADATGPKHLDVTLTRAKFEELTADLIQATIEPTRKAMSDAGLSASDIDKVLLVGGSSRIPAVQEAIKKVLGKEPTKNVNPDECVAIGAAIQGGVLVGEVKDVLLLDVTPLSLGIETMGGVFTRIIDRNTTIPTSKSQVFSTAADNQPSVDIHVLQGEREFAADNKTLGRFNLDGIPAAPRGVPQIEVTFDIDANGIVHVKAKDLGTQKEQKITITSSSGLKEEEIDRMVKEAEAHAAEDKARKEELDVKNNADSLVYQAEKALKDLEGKGDAALMKEVEEAKDKLKKSIEASNIEDIKKDSEALEQPLHKLAEQMYAAAQQAQQAAGATDQGQQQTKSDDNVVDADYTVVDDDKK